MRRKYIYITGLFFVAALVLLCWAAFAPHEMRLENCRMWSDVTALEPYLGQWSIENASITGVREYGHDEYYARGTTSLESVEELVNSNGGLQIYESSQQKLDMLFDAVARLNLSQMVVQDLSANDVRVVEGFIGGEVYILLAVRPTSKQFLAYVVVPRR